MICNYKTSWLRDLYSIDLRANEWPWSEEKWNDIKEYIIKVYCIDDVPRAFSAFRVVPNEGIHVYKLSVDPKWANFGIGGGLHEDIVKFAIDHGKQRLTTMVHERDEKGIKWLGHWGWLAQTIERAQYPDGGDGIIFVREIVQ